jgi:hypothetical protein
MAPVKLRPIDVALWLRVHADVASGDVARVMCVVCITAQVSHAWLASSIADDGMLQQLP